MFVFARWKHLSPPFSHSDNKPRKEDVDFSFLFRRKLFRPAAAKKRPRLLLSEWVTNAEKVRVLDVKYYKGLFIKLSSFSFRASSLLSSDVLQSASYRNSTNWASSLAFR